jgi:hypothetical protein
MNKNIPNLLRLFHISKYRMHFLGTDSALRFYYSENLDSLLFPSYQTFLELQGRVPLSNLNWQEEPPNKRQWLSAT